MIKYNPKIHNRRSIRLKGYDYTRAGLYFVTICCQNRNHLFGKIENGIMILNDAGEMIERLWHDIPNDFSNIILHEYISMPNHIHGIVFYHVDYNSPLKAFWRMVFFSSSRLVSFFW
jgi:REP element-mobilizing transposase RayT